MLYMTKKCRWTTINRFKLYPSILYTTCFLSSSLENNMPWKDDVDGRKHELGKGFSQVVVGIVLGVSDNDEGTKQFLNGEFHEIAWVLRDEYTM